MASIIESSMLTPKVTRRMPQSGPAAWPRMFQPASGDERNRLVKRLAAVTRTSSLAGRPDGGDKLGDIGTADDEVEFLSSILPPARKPKSTITVTLRKCLLIIRSLTLPTCCDVAVPLTWRPKDWRKI